MQKGKLIVVEGACDGIGKSTQFSLLKKYFEENNYDVVSHHFPSYGTFHGTPVEKYLSGFFGTSQDTSPYFVNGLYAMDRACTWYTKLKQEYDDGKIILLDRYTTSSLIYQTAVIEDIEERKKFIDYVIDFEYHKLGVKEPDAVIFLNASFDLVTKIRNERKANEGVADDIYERDLELMRKVYNNALFVADYLSFSQIRCDKDDEMRSIDEIHEDIKKLVREKFNK